MLRNFLKEFHETMIETIGYSAIKDIVGPKSKEKEIEYDLDNVEIEVNLVEVL